MASRDSLAAPAFLLLAAFYVLGFLVGLAQFVQVSQDIWRIEHIGQDAEGWQLPFFLSLPLFALLEA